MSPMSSPSGAIEQILKFCTDKCRYFVIKKNGNQSTQFRPYLKVGNEVIPAVKLISFVYLGKEFCYNKPCENMKCVLLKRLILKRISGENRHSFLTSET